MAGVVLLSSGHFYLFELSERIVVSSWENTVEEAKEINI